MQSTGDLPAILSNDLNMLLNIHSQNSNAYMNKTRNNNKFDSQFASMFTSQQQIIQEIQVPVFTSRIVLKGSCGSKVNENTNKYEEWNQTKEGKKSNLRS